MRIDKFLKVSRIIKRRTVANEACSGGRVMINHKIVKPSAEINEGDILTIRFGEHVGYYEVLSVRESVNKDHAAELYKVLEEDPFISSVRSES